MGTNKKWIFASLLVLLLVQLSCSVYEFYDDRTDRERERDRCEEDGGIWHDYPRAYCELPNASSTPSQTGERGTVTLPFVSQTAAPFETSQCDASAAVNIAPILTEETFSSESRWCSYTQTTTNISDQEVMFFYHSVRNTQAPSWVSVLLSPAEEHTFLGYLQDTDYGGLTYSYIDQVAAVYYIEACQEAIHFSDTAAAAELFAMEAAHFCSP